MSAPVQIELSPSQAAPAQARAWLADAFDGLEATELETALLLLSELVTNAVVHGEGEITVRAQLDEDRLLIEVMDTGGGFEWQLRERDFEQVGGLGLYVVDAESSRWGIHEGSTHVWFELERRGPRLGAEKKPPLA